MKAYVIKNKEGKYWQWLFNDEPSWEDKLYNGFLHYSKEDAEKSIIQWQLKDCEVVEITIAEGDLEQENKKYKKDYEILMTAYKEVIYKYLNVIDNYSEEEEKHCCEYFIEQAREDKL